VVWVAGGRGVSATAQAACKEDPTVEVSGRARPKRTENMKSMSVTLEVSRLSGWLNADASCRVRTGAGRGVACTCGPGGGRSWGSGGGASSVQGNPTVKAAGRAGAERTRNMAYMVVTLEVSKLSGWLNADAPCQVEREA
jgi:hypothetical protein